MRWEEMRPDNMPPLAAGNSVVVYREPVISAIFCADSLAGAPVTWLDEGREHVITDDDLLRYSHWILFRPSNA